MKWWRTAYLLTLVALLAAAPEKAQAPQPAPTKTQETKTQETKSDDTAKRTFKVKRARRCC